MFTTFLREAVRDRQLLGWEEAIHLITQVPAVIVNGAVAVHDNALTGRSPGVTIRSGRDTVTPSMSPQT